MLFSGLDLSNPADLATLSARIQALGSRVNTLSNTDLGGFSVQQVTSTLSTISGLLGSGATPASTGTTSHAPPPGGSNTPSGTSGTSFDLSPVVNAITSGFSLANSHLAMIEQHTGALAADLTKGGLLTTVSTGLQQGADLTGANSGVKG